MRQLSCDFETLTTSPTRVWAWGSCDINDWLEDTGTSIESWFEYVSRETSRVYFHNLKFDGNFIIYFLFKQGFKVSEGKFPGRGEFKAVISDTGQWYKITIKTDEGTIITIIDSYKIIPISVDAIPKAFGLNISKLSIDYGADRAEDHELTKEEKEYVLTDVRIVARALRIMFDRGMNKITASSNAMASIKEMVGDGHKYYYPVLELSVDKDCRKSYKGGWSFVNPKYKGLIVGEGLVFDVNSMYPYNMRDRELPVGVPIYYKGKYVKDELYPLYIQSLECELKLKEHRYPSIQIKSTTIYNDCEYIEETKGPTLLTLTSVDLDLMFENYDVYNITYIGGYKFKSAIGVHSDYIDYWYKEKTGSRLEGNSAYTYIAKLFLNGAYGKYGSNPIKKNKIPYYDEENDIVRYKLGGEEVLNDGYVPLASFITSYSRDMIIRAANACGDRFLYADTDSLHILGTEPPPIDIDNERLGAFKLESTFSKAKYLRPKCYIEEGEVTLKKCAGLPEACRGSLNFETLQYGQEFGGKLVPKVVPGGVILVERVFKIKK